jgi:hypothetical protein
MVGKAEISNVRGLLKAVRLQIVLLQKEVERNPHDKEFRKLLRKAKSEESVILAKLAEWTLN